MSAVLEPRYTLEQYVAREAVAEFKSEFYRGQIFAMAGGTPRHNTVSGNIFARLHERLRGTGCRPYNSDQRIRIPANGLSTYPDVSIVCGEPQLDSLDRIAITNPIVIFEVLSEKTESYDRGRKADMYRQLPSLREYILVCQDEPQVERFVRQDDDSWLLTIFKGLEAVLELRSPGCRLPLAEIYEDIAFGPEGEPIAG